MRCGCINLDQPINDRIWSRQSSNQGLRFLWYSEFRKRVTPEVLERRGLIRDAHNMTGGQQAALSLVGGMSAGIFSVFGNNRT